VVGRSWQGDDHFADVLALEQAANGAGQRVESMAFGFQRKELPSVHPAGHGLLIQTAPESGRWPISIPLNGIHAASSVSLSQRVSASPDISVTERNLLT
jgi:hypothetical protein